MVAISETVVKKVAALLEEGGDSPLDLAKSVVELVDEVRAEKTRYTVVCQYGRTPCWYIGYGPYPTMRKAEDAIKKMPATHEATHVAIVPVTTPEALVRKTEELDAPAADWRTTRDWKLVKADAEKFKKMRKR